MLNNISRAARWRSTLLILTVIIGVDQAVKWWAWRFVADATINTGGDQLVGKTVGSWYSDDLGGALLDVLSAVVLAGLVTALMQRRHDRLTVAAALLFLGGWLSNLTDRLGFHNWTAPGSDRGAVDFIHYAGRYYNVADICIIAAVPLVVLAATRAGVVNRIRRDRFSYPAPAPAADLVASTRP